MTAPAALEIVRGGARDAPRLLALFDDAITWMVARGRTDQWGSEPYSARPSHVAQVGVWAASGGLWLAVAQDDLEQTAGAIVLGDAPVCVPGPDRDELYVVVLLTATAWRGRGVGRRLIEHALATARDRGVAQLRVDCWAGDPALPAHYERLGFRRTGSFTVEGWPGAILVQEL
ncbi:MAG: hypothetical protein QOE11_2496 [Solirubrobacteraceae bacterium]|nr:hypothetical protein [Solirubrobacteraceae bacterium]